MTAVQVVDSDAPVTWDSLLLGLGSHLHPLYLSLAHLCEKLQPLRMLIQVLQVVDSKSLMKTFVCILKY